MKYINKIKNPCLFNDIIYQLKLNNLTFDFTFFISEGPLITNLLITNFINFFDVANFGLKAPHREKLILDIH